MAIVRVWNGGNNSNPKDGDWASAAINITGALGHNIEPVSAGDTILVASDHYSIIGTAITYNLPTSVFIQCVDRTTEVATTGAVEGILNSWQTFIVQQLSSNSTAIIRGIKFQYLTNACDGPNPARIWYDQCYFVINSYQLSLVSGWQKKGKIKITNSTIDFNSANSSIAHTCVNEIILKNITCVNTNSVSTIFVGQENFMASSHLEVWDTDLNFGTYLSNSMKNHDRIRLINCKTKNWTTPGYTYNQGVIFENCATGVVEKTKPILYQEYKPNDAYVVYDNNNYRTAFDGLNYYSIVFKDTQNRYLPEYIEHTIGNIWHNASGPKALTVRMSGPANLTDGRVWLHVISPNEDNIAKGRFVSTRAAYSSGNVYNVADTSPYLKSDNINNWVNGGNTAYKIVVTGINPIFPGNITVSLYYCQPGTTDYLYVCPNMELL